MGLHQVLPPEPVFYNQQTQDIVRQAIQLRYNLLPYNYTLAWENTSQGRPLIRPLFYHFPDDPEVWSLDDQYLWGKDLLIAPIFEKEQSKRKLYLPRGTWTEWHTGNKHPGKQWINVSVSQENIPVFVRNGAFIPMAPDLQNTGSYDWKKINVHFFPGISVNRSSGSIYIDDGKSRLSSGSANYHLIDMQGETNAKEMIIQLAGSGEGYDGEPDTQEMTFVIHGVKSLPKRVLVYGKKVFLSMDENILLDPGPDVAYWDSTNYLLKIRLNWHGQTTLINIKGRILND